MRITADMAELHAAVAFAGKAVETRNAIPVMQAVRLEACDDRATVRGSRFDMTLEADAPAAVLAGGVALAPFAQLHAFLAAARAERVELHADKDGLAVAAGRSRMAFRPIDPGDFPDYRPAAGEPVPVDADTFSAALRFVAPAVSTEETRYYLTGTYVEEGGDGHVHLWATDGHRLHHAELPGLPTIGGGGIFPGKAIASVLPLIEGSAAPRVMVSDKGWHVRGFDRRAWGAAVEGTYPDARAVMGRREDRRLAALAHRDALAQGVAVAQVGQDTRTRAVVLTGLAGGPLVLRGLAGMDAVRTAGEGEVEGEVREDFGVGVNGPYLAATLAALPAGEVAVELPGVEGGPLRVAPSQASVTLPLEAIIMPMRVDAGLFLSREREAA